MHNCVLYFGRHLRVHHLDDSDLLNCVQMSELRPYSALFVVGLQEDSTTKCDMASLNCRHMYAGMLQRKNLNDLRSVLLVVFMFILPCCFLQLLRI